MASNVPVTGAKPASAGQQNVASGITPPSSITAAPSATIMPLTAILRLFARMDEHPLYGDSFDAKRAFSCIITSKGMNTT